MSATRVVHVAVAVIGDEAGRVLVAQRLPHQHLAGLWEFPGGKVEPGETLFEGMRREIREELGITVESLAPLLRIEHRYPEKTVLLDVWRVLRWSGPAPGAQGAEGQPLRWVLPAEMDATEYPPADVPIIAALNLPAHYVISPDLATPQDIARWVSALPRLPFTPALLQVRLLAQPDLAARVIADVRCALPAARVFINSGTLQQAGAGSTAAAFAEACVALGADGLHLRAADLARLEARPSLPCAASCHDAAELARAFALALDFATLSPVLPTRSHPEAATLGWTGFASLAAAGLPVYALGGMNAGALDTALQHGAAGVAGISLGSPAQD